jgi:hypothetical protein
LLPSSIRGADVGTLRHVLVGLIGYWSAREVRADVVQVPFEVDAAPVAV